MRGNRRILVPFSPSALGLKVWALGSSHRTRRLSSWPDKLCLSAGCPPQRFTRGRPLPLQTSDVYQPQKLLLGFVPLQRSQSQEPTGSIPDVAIVRNVPPPEFLTLSTASCSHDPPALFHAGHAHGVPSRSRRLHIIR